MNSNYGELGNSQRFSDIAVEFIIRIRVIRVGKMLGNRGKLMLDLVDKADRENLPTQLPYNLRETKNKVIYCELNPNDSGTDSINRYSISSPSYNGSDASFIYDQIELNTSEDTISDNSVSRCIELRKEEKELLENNALNVTNNNLLESASAETAANETQNNTEPTYTILQNALPFRTDLYSQSVQDTNIYDTSSFQYIITPSIKGNTHPTVIDPYKDEVEMSWNSIINSSSPDSQINKSFEVPYVQQITLQSNIHKQCYGISVPKGGESDSDKITIIQNERVDVLKNITSQLNSNDTNSKISEQNNVDRTIIKFGKIVMEPQQSIENSSSNRPWTKRSVCPYCYKDVTHFPRHLTRNHGNEGAVKEMLTLSLKDPKRKILLNVLRRQGNYYNTKQSNIVRPIRRPKELIEENIEKGKDLYVTCQDCLGYFKRNYLRRHRKKCALNKTSILGRQNHLGEEQMLRICSSNNEFYDSLRLKKEVLSIMRPDVISKTAIGDVLICSYAENLLRRHKRVQIRTVISNKMRELGRLLINLRESTGVGRLIDALIPEFFDNIIIGTKIISGYDAEARTFKASSLALHMGTTLKQVCDVANKMIIKRSRFLPCEDPEKTLKNIKRLRHLIASQWNSEISSLALKNLKENQWQKPKLFPLTSDLIKFQEFVMQEAKSSCEKLKKKHEIKKEFRRLCENVLALTILLNRKRISEVQYLTVASYNTTDISIKQQEEFLQTLSENEKAFTKSFKRVVTGGKQTRPVAILFPKNIQKFIEVMLSLRHECVPETNHYLFPNPSTNDKSLSGYHVLKKLASESGVENQELFTSTRLRKQIATTLQVMNVNEKEIEQFASFMGHTKKTHETFYRLPQDIYQTAKVSKLLMAINKGKGAEYSGKTLDEIEFSDNIDSDSDSDSIETEHMCTTCDFAKVVAGPSSITDCNEHENSRNYNQNIESSDEDCDNVTKGKRKTKIQRIRWSEKQKKILTNFFSTHIKDMKAPKKHEVEVLLQQYKKEFDGKNWVKIKAFVYNCYKK